MFSTNYFAWTWVDDYTILDRFVTHKFSLKFLMDKFKGAKDPQEIVLLPIASFQELFDMVCQTFVADSESFDLFDL